MKDDLRYKEQITQLKTGKRFGQSLKEDIQLVNKHMKRASLARGNANQNHREIPPHTQDTIKRWIITSVGKDMEKLGALQIAKWEYKMMQPLWKNLTAT